MDTMISANLFSKYTSARALSQSSMIVATDTLRQQIEAEIASTRLGAVGYELLMLVLRQSTVNSAVNTNVFQLSEPGSNTYEIINAFYPRHEHARFNNVSTRPIHGTTHGKNFEEKPHSTAVYKLWNSRGILATRESDRLLGWNLPSITAVRYIAVLRGIFTPNKRSDYCGLIRPLKSGVSLYRGATQSAVLCCAHVDLHFSLISSSTHYTMRFPSTALSTVATAFL